MSETRRDAKIVFTLLLLFVVVREGLSIKCFVCRSDIDAKCADPFDNSTVSLPDCTHQERPKHMLEFGPATMCRKIRQKVGGVWKYFRSCAYVGEPGIEGDERFCLMRTGSYNIFMEYCTCNSKDGCNAGTNLRGSFIVSAIAALSTLLFVPNFA